MFLLVVYRHHTFPPSSITYELECILSKQPTLLIRTFVEQLMYLKNKYLCTSLQVGRAPHTIIPVVQLVVSWVSTSLILLFSRSVVSDSLRPHESQHARLPVHHQLPEFTQTRVHRVGDAIQPSPPLSAPSPPAFGLSQHQGLFQWVSSSQQMTKALEFQLQHRSFQWIFRVNFH